ncbi:MAG: purine-binding chemotaxis protein CheW [Gemmatimonadaceae bacterium]|nr:purine-binding chemotaxis protein CheW [Gemmatimonadaceae bacterium]NUQ93508.1 purine-binding chemotaxis protein CheW [Gemmatimonadaceae bacterium]NUR20027.1 purine-binding chemotaxis protein CheW [Gemmatimonadaceae bacterium]NUS96358.1 purine-binding chemotaxis protein CheW [Gemmatimonadaceae bacterium]
MTKKRKISYSQLAPEGAKSQGSGVGGQGPAAPAPPKAEQAPASPVEPVASPEPKPEPKPKRVAKPRAPRVAAEIAPAPLPPVVAPDVVPEVQLHHRVSSPVEIASVLRASGPHALTLEPPVAEQPPTPEPGSPPPESAPQSVEDYATALARRLAAMAPPEIDEAEDADRDDRPLRERVRSGEGVADLLMFRIGPEIFATELGAVEEAVTLPEIHHLPEMPAAMLGAFNLRGRLTPVYSPAHVIGVPLAGAAQAALLVSANGRRLGLAVDDVEDVFQVDLASIREAPGIDAADGILLGVAHHGQELVAVLDAEALVAACLTGHVMETA